MDLSDILANVADQDRGRPCLIVDPWTGEPTAIIFTLAGPDSHVQRRARILMMDELAEASELDGSISAKNRERARINCLARCVLGMSIEQDGDAVMFNHKNVVRVLKSAAWLQAQVDSFAGDRSRFAPER